MADLIFVDRNSNLCSIEGRVKNKFRWSWLEEKDTNGDFLSALIYDMFRVSSDNFEIDHLQKFYSRRPDGLSGALNDLGIHFDGRQHSGLDDSRNTAKLAYRMMCDGCILNITKTMKFGLHEPSFSHQRTSIGQVIGSLSSHSSTIHQDRKPCTASVSYKKPSCVEKKKIHSLKKSENQTLLLRNTNTLVSMKVSEKENVKKSDSIKCINYSDSANGNTLFTDSTCRTSIYSTIGKINKSNVCTPDRGTETLSACDASIFQRKPLADVSVIGTDVSQFNLGNKSYVSNASTALTLPFKTPSPTESKSSMRVTPPLCTCGRRSKRRCVQNPGPNTGRWFFSCPFGVSSWHGKSGGCKFFKWESSSKNVTPK